MIGTFDPLRLLFYELIVIDVPWKFKLRSEKGAAKSAPYRTMTKAEVCALPVGQLASRGCLLLSWATAPELPTAIEAVKAWGFTYKSFMVWRKTTINNKVRMGTGYRVRSTGEIIIMATMGNPLQAIAPQTIFDGLAREHSRKPEEFYQLCDRLMPHARRADVFARERRPGWDSFGDQLDYFERSDDDGEGAEAQDEAVGDHSGREAAGSLHGSLSLFGGGGSGDR